MSTSPELTVFVAGATGYTGREVVARLLARGVSRVVAHVRPDSSSLERWRAHFTDLGAQLDTTPWTLDAMTASLAGHAPSLVFSLLGTTRKRARAEGSSASEHYEAVDYGLTKCLLDACVASPARPRFVYLSAAGVSARSRGAYMQARWRAEEAVRASGLPHLIARPSFITGSDRDEPRPGERIGSALTDGALTLGRMFGASKLAARYQSMTGEALARGLVTLALEADSDKITVEGEALRAASSSPQ